MATLSAGYIGYGLYIDRNLSNSRPMGLKTGLYILGAHTTNGGKNPQVREMAEAAAAKSETPTNKGPAFVHGTVGSQVLLLVGGKAREVQGTSALARELRQAVVDAVKVAEEGFVAYPTNRVTIHTRQATVHLAMHMPRESRKHVASPTKLTEAALVQLTSAVA